MRVILLAFSAFSAIAVSAETYNSSPTTLETVTTPEVPTSTSIVAEPTATHKPIYDLEYAEVFGKLFTDMKGFVHLGDDGVIRSYAANGTVIDYVRLTNAQIFQSFNDGRFNDTMVAHFNQTFANISGYKIADDSHLLTPPVHIKPLEFQTEEAMKKFQAVAEAQENDQSNNPLHDTKRHLEGRQSWTFDPDMPFCYGRDCTRSENCYFMGCLSCESIDQSRMRFCFGIRDPHNPPPHPAYMCSTWPYC